MLISRIANDVHAAEFAAKHATALVPPSDEGGFAQYLARVMDNPSERSFSSQSLRDQASRTESEYTQPVHEDPYHTTPYAPPEWDAERSTPDSQGRKHEPAKGVPDADRDVDETTTLNDPKTIAETSDDHRNSSSVSNPDAEGAAAAGREKAVTAEPGDAGQKRGSATNADAASDGEAGEKHALQLEESATRLASDSAVAKLVSEAEQVKARAAGEVNQKAAGSMSASGIKAPLSALDGGEESGLPHTSARTRVVERSSDSVTLEVTIDANESTAGKRAQAAAEGEAASEEIRPGTNDAVLSRKVNHGDTQARAEKGSVAANAAADGLNPSREVEASANRSAREGRVEVTDLRTAAREHASSGDTGSGSFGSGAHGDGSGESAESRFAELVSGRSSAAPETGSLADQSRAGGFASRLNAHQSSPADAGSRLGHSLREGLSSEIVRQAKFVIRDNDSGSIRLTLKPEHLGSVRIALQMQDGHIAGRIIVDNQSVREAFEQNLAALERAFEEAGMEMDQLDVTLADSGSRGEQSENPAGGRTKGFARGTEALAGAVPEMDWIADDHELVDVMA